MSTCDDVALWVSEYGADGEAAFGEAELRLFDGLVEQFLIGHDYRIVVRFGKVKSYCCGSCEDCEWVGMML